MKGWRLVEQEHHSRKKNVVSCEEMANASTTLDGSAGNEKTKL